MSATDLDTLIDSIPGGEGWWRQSGRDGFKSIAKILIDDYGLERIRAVELLEWAYAEVAGEFGQ